MKKLWVIFLAVSFIGCTNVTNKPKSSNEFHELLKQTIFPIPDSLLTNEQIELKIKFWDLFFKHVYVENNYQKLDIGKELFVKEGIPEIYYDVIQYQLRENNECIDKWIEEGDTLLKQVNWDEVMKEAIERYWKMERPELIKRLENK